jgi:hypothetical protein
MTYCKINLATLLVAGQPAPLPDIVDGMSDDDLSDLSFLPAEHGLSGIGYWPVVPVDPGFDVNYETLDAPVVFEVDAPSQRVLSSRTVRSLTPEEMEPLRAQRRAVVMLKRDQVIDGGFVFNGVRFQTGATDRENISGAAQLAFMALLAEGRQPGDLRWHGGDSDFGWIALDNTVIPMDAPTVIEFGKAIAAFKQACIFYARYLKDQIDTAVNPAAIDIETGWPS